MKQPSPQSAARRTKCYGDPRALTPLDPNSSYAKVIELLEPGATVLDVGCGAGELDRYLAERGHRVWAVDANPAALASAAPYCVEVRQADLESTDLTEVFGDLRFDAIVFADSLEHLRETWRALQSARELLNEHGTVVASIPNFAHAAVRLAIMSGSMPYRRSGILDDTHLRFFTRAGVESLFLECGFRVQTIARTALAFGAPSDLVPDVGALRVPEPIERLAREDPDSETLQFVVRAVLVPGPWDAAAMRTHVHDLQARIAEQTIGLANLERDAAGLRELLAAAHRERDALAAERDAAAAERDASAAAASTAAAAASAAAAERNALREALGDLQARGEAAARAAEARVQAADAGARREREEAARLAAALADAVRERDRAAAERDDARRERDEAAARAEAEAAQAAEGFRDAHGRAAEAASRLRILELRTIEAERRAAELEAAVAAERNARAEAADAARRLETTVRDAALAGSALAGRTPPESGSSAVEAVAALAEAAAALADGLASARTRLAAADAGAVAARAEVEAARARAAEARSALEAEAAGLRSALEAERRRLAAVEEERDELRRREAERETLRRLLDEHETVAVNGAAADGRQLWPLEDAGSG